MRTQSDAFPQQINFARYHNQPQGHYESFFQRANHPSRPLAFWIRYTIFSPRNRPQDATGELWAVFFNGETNQHVTVKHEVPLDQCTFRSSAFFAQIGEATLQPERLSGMVRMQEDTIAWEFIYHSDEKPLLLLPSPLLPDETSGCQKSGRSSLGNLYRFSGGQWRDDHSRKVERQSKP